MIGKSVIRVASAPVPAVFARIARTASGPAMVLLLFSLLAAAVAAETADIYRKPAGVRTRWATFENPGGDKGAGGKSNRGAKGSAAAPLRPGETAVLLDVKGAGTVTRLWFTLDPLTPELLRALRLEMYWDQAPTPAVAAPLGDFFGAVHGRAVPFESELFSSPEGRSLVCTIPMPFRSSARITLTNDSDQEVKWLFYEADYLLVPSHDPDTLYFHATWRRERWTEAGRDFEILPLVRGAGRFIGAHVGVIPHPDIYGWWGEGEVKVYLDGDRDHPTLVGTGVEDYIGTAWQLAPFSHRHQGCLLADGEHGLYAFYRHHVPDPVYFDRDVRVTLQQLGSAPKSIVQQLVADGLPVIPVKVELARQEGKRFSRHRRLLLDEDPPPALADVSMPKSAPTLYYRSDDVCAAAFFYLNRPENGLPALAPLEKRTEGLAGAEPVQALPDFLDQGDPENPFASR